MIGVGSFATSTRARIVEARAALAELKQARTQAARVFARLDKQQDTARERAESDLANAEEALRDRLDDDDKAHELEGKFSDAASLLGECGVAGSSGSATDELAAIDDVIRTIADAIKEEERDLAAFERAAGRLGLL